MAETRTFTRDELDELGLPWELQDSEEVERHRWYTVRRGVFELEGAHWEVEYIDPATEMQEDIDPWADAVAVIAHKVVRRPVTVERWVRASQAGPEDLYVLQATREHMARQMPG